VAFDWHVPKGPCEAGTREGLLLGTFCVRAWNGVAIGPFEDIYYYYYYYYYE
jgi:hypothetical protein